MSFFDKIKKGVSEAGQKAKITVEVNRLKLQISAKRRDIETKYKLMGEAYFQAHMQGSTEGLEPELQAYSEDVIRLLEDIAEMQARIKDISNEKSCACGKVVTLDTKFCPNCGHQFDGSEQLVIPDTLARHVNCPSCEKDVEEGARYCSDCGHSLV